MVTLLKAPQVAVLTSDGYGGLLWREFSGMSIFPLDIFAKGVNPDLFMTAFQ